MWETSLQDQAKSLLKTRFTESRRGFGVPSGFASTGRKHSFWTGRNWDDVFKFWSHLVIYPRLFIQQIALWGLLCASIPCASRHWRCGMEHDRHGACPDRVYVSKGDTVNSILIWFGWSGELFREWAIPKEESECIWNERLEKPVEDYLLIWKAQAGRTRE